MRRTDFFHFLMKTFFQIRIRIRVSILTGADPDPQHCLKDPESQRYNLENERATWHPVAIDVNS